jgi:pimeloyl-ACP methyl ester carboxylesterase
LARGEERRQTISEVGIVRGSGYMAVEFTSSDGTTLRGRLYLPEADRPPIVVMAHGFSATIPMVLDRYAEVFRARGVAALAFDHPGLGTSDGQPRGEINGWVSARAYRGAIDWACSRPEIDPERIAVWGDSRSTRVALVVAALDERVRALVCQVPAMGREIPAAGESGARFEAIAALVRQGEVRRPPEEWVSMPVVSFDQVSIPSALTPLTAFRWFMEYGGRYGSGWSNRVLLTEPEGEPAFDPFACAGQVRVPTQFLVSPDDEMPGAASHVARAVFDLVPGSKELVEVEGGHFGIVEHPSTAFDRASAAEADFLARVLAVE